MKREQQALLMKMQLGDIKNGARSRACLKNHSCDLHSPLQASWTANVQDDADNSSQI